HETTYGAMQRFIEKPPGKLRIFEIYPPKPLLSMALGSRLPALRMDYKTGRLCGRYFLATVGKMLAEQPPLHRHKSIILPPAVVANDAVAMPLV
ncbi:patatin family protein, partial [Klebsiella pneumoniae]